MAKPVPGFTLVELLIVAVVVAIFAAVVVQSTSGSDTDAKLAAAQQAVRALQKAVDTQHARTGAYPARIEKAWFRGYRYPVNPYATRRLNNPIISNGDYNKWHPRDKYVYGAAPHFYYNPLNGVVRIRVERLADDAETLALYNRANGTSATAFQQQDLN